MSAWLRSAGHQFPSWLCLRTLCDKLHLLALWKRLTANIVWVELGCMYRCDFGVAFKSLHKGKVPSGVYSVCLTLWLIFGRLCVVDSALEAKLGFRGFSSAPTLPTFRQTVTSMGLSFANQLPIVESLTAIEECQSSESVAGLVCIPATSCNVQPLRYSSHHNQLTHRFT